MKFIIRKAGQSPITEQPHELAVWDEKLVEWTTDISILDELFDENMIEEGLVIKYIDKDQLPAIELCKKQGES